MSTVAEWGMRKTFTLLVKRTGVANDTVGAPFAVHGIVFGEWAAHPMVSGMLDEPAEIDTSKWCVSHIPSGRSVPGVMVKEVEAIAIAAIIAGRMGGSIRVHDRGAMRLDHQKIMIESVEVVLPRAYAGVRFDFR